MNRIEKIRLLKNVFAGRQPLSDLNAARGWIFIQDGVRYTDTDNNQVWTIEEIQQLNTTVIILPKRKAA